MSETEEWQPKCGDCERRVDRRNLQRRKVAVDRPDESGYDLIPMPLCPACIGKRFGYDCPQCGINHSNREDAEHCCRRRPGESPDCPNCGRRMDRVSWGFHADGRPTCEVAECEPCGVMWGKYTGFEGVDE